MLRCHQFQNKSLCNDERDLNFAARERRWACHPHERAEIWLQMSVMYTGRGHALMRSQQYTHLSVLGRT
jgi:hypothetical protein